MLAGTLLSSLYFPAVCLQGGKELPAPAEVSPVLPSRGQSRLGRRILVATPSG